MKNGQVKHIDYETMRAFPIRLLGQIVQGSSSLGVNVVAIECIISRHF